MRNTRAAVLMVAVVGLAAAPTLAAEAVQGLMATQGVTGRTATPHGWVEERVFVGQLRSGFGAGTTTAAQPPGWFSISGAVRPGGFPAGDYAIFTLSYDSAPAFSVNPRVSLSGGTETLENMKLDTPAHYSVIYNTDSHEWADEPWLAGDSFYQTFVATGPHITRIATKLADKSGDHAYLTLNFAVYEAGKGPPSTWKRISPVRSRFLSGNTDPIIHVFWVPYRSNEVTLTPGKLYAIRLWRDPSSQSETFSLVARPDHGDGYAGGCLYVGDTPRKDYDAYAYVSGGATGTIVNHAPVGSLELKDLIGAGTRFGQTFRATGVGLAAVDIIYATGDARPPELPITFQVYDKLGGKPIGPAKTCYGTPAAFQGRAAAIWARGDVPLVPGKIYYLEWTSPGCNTWRLNEDLPGEAYVDEVAKPDADLAMSIVEYTADK
jgi:hypothetical protein